MRLTSLAFSFAAFRRKVLAPPIPKPPHLSLNLSSFPQLVRSSRGLRLAAFASALAVGTAASAAHTPEATVDGVAGMLGEASQGQVVRPADVRWEPSRGALSDLVFGRRV